MTWSATPNTYTRCSCGPVVTLRRTLDPQSWCVMHRMACCQSTGCSCFVHIKSIKQNALPTLSLPYTPTLPLRPRTFRRHRCCLPTNKQRGRDYPHLTRVIGDVDRDRRQGTREGVPRPISGGSQVRNTSHVISKTLLGASRKKNNVEALCFNPEKVT